MSDHDIHAVRERLEGRAKRHRAADIPDLDLEALLADHARLQNEVSASRIGGSGHSGEQPVINHGATAALAQEPTAWRYEFSTQRQEDGFRDGSLIWHVGYSATPPSFEVRNLTPLYAHLSGVEHA